MSYDMMNFASSDSAYKSERVYSVYIEIVLYSFSWLLM